MSDNQISEIEVTIEQAKAQIEKMEALGRLANNEDFKLVIDDGYFLKEASNLVLLLAAPGFASEEEQNRLNKNITAIGFLRQYFSGIMQIGAQAQKSVIDDENTRSELLEEGGS